MLFFHRFWYSVFELISNKSNFKDIPYAGTALVLFIMIEILVLTVIGYWRCFSIIAGSIAISLSYSRILWTILLCIPFPIILFYCKKMGPQIVDRFKDESNSSKKKRRRGSGFFCFF